MHKDPPYSNTPTYAYTSRIMYGSLEIHILHVHDCMYNLAKYNVSTWWFITAHGEYFSP